eukprot:PhM_4_TR2043/c0_g1_i1/m.64025
MTDDLKAFPFFELETSEAPHDTMKKLEFTSSCMGLVTSEFPKLYFGDAEGNVFVADKTPEMSVEPTFFKAHTGPVSAMYQLHGRPYLVTVGPEQGEEHAVAKLWDLERYTTDPSTTPPGHIIRIFGPKTPSCEPANLPLTFNKKVKVTFQGNPVGDAGSKREIPDRKGCILHCAVSEDAGCLVLGLASNEVVVVRGDLEKEK